MNSSETSSLTPSGQEFPWFYIRAVTDCYLIDPLNTDLTA